MNLGEFFQQFDKGKVNLEKIFSMPVSVKDRELLHVFFDQVSGKVNSLLGASLSSNGTELLKVVEKKKVLELLDLQNEILDLIENPFIPGAN